MRYPIWAFFFVLVMPPFAVHALLAGKARIAPDSAIMASYEAPQDVYFSRVTTSR
ncbi:hypothetical protein [Devosia sediminis]|uniref:Uncharacterized protein n=1 Tax=Devosia sediminis TaxID=2798801 RepID=A0A934MLQ1_9HYPH|nr:hypothetical protein [Devosia sediminis]MBJ3786483.1 hypothetical protein [Devosia sediminis]